MEKEPEALEQTEAVDTVSDKDLTSFNKKAESFDVEDEYSRGKKIKELRNKIKETMFQQERIRKMQENYAVPNEALTDADSLAMNVSVEQLQERLRALEEQKKKSNASFFRTTFKKLVSFLTFN